MSNKSVEVAVGVITKVDESGDTLYFLTKRSPEAHQGDKWEFPGGKVEKDETVAQALARELKEEVGIEVLACQALINIEHDYGDKCVSLDVYIVDNYSGIPCAQEGQGEGWFTYDALTLLDFPAANQAIIAALLKY